MRGTRVWIACSALLLALAAVALLLFSASPAAAQSATTDYDDNNDGLIEVSNLLQLGAIRYDLNGDGTVDEDANQGRYAVAFPNPSARMGCPSSGCKGYELTEHLNFDVNGDGEVNLTDFDSNGNGRLDRNETDFSNWRPIGYGFYSLTAVFVGNGHIIRNLRINRPDDDFLGLFGRTFTGAHIRNLGLVGAEVTGRDMVGTLVGEAAGESQISEVYASGGSMVRGKSTLGGLVGYIKGGSVEYSYSTAQVEGTDRLGGLVGVMKGGYVLDSYSTGSVTVTGSAYKREELTIVPGNAGGLVGLIEGSTAAFISNSYTISPVTAKPGITPPQNLGGLFGHSTNANLSVARSYWNTELATGPNVPPADRYGKTGIQMRYPTDALKDIDPDTAGVQNIYVNWPGNRWDFGHASLYPALKVNWDGDSEFTWQEFGDQWKLVPPPPARFTVTGEVGSRELLAQWEQPDRSKISTYLQHITPFTTSYEVQYRLRTGTDPDRWAWGPWQNGPSVTEDYPEVPRPSSFALSVKPGVPVGLYEMRARALNSEGAGAWTRPKRGLLGGVAYDDNGDGLISINTLDQLNAVRWDLDGDGAADDRANRGSYNAAFPNAVDGLGCPQSGCIGYELIRNLDFDENNDNTITRADATFWNGGLGWAPIGSRDEPYSGVFEGNRHFIYNLYIRRTDQNYAGLFAAIGGEIRNLRLKNVKIRAQSLVGGITGHAASGSSIKRSSVNGSVDGRNGIGVLVGYNEGDIQTSYSTGSISGTGGAGGIGGLVGSNRGFIKVSYSQASVTNTLSGGNIGGLVGYNHNGGIIQASYATGQVTARQTANAAVKIGGLVGSNDGVIQNSYSTGRVTAPRNSEADIGGLVGKVGIGLTARSYWNAESSGQTDSAAGTSKITSLLRSPTDYGTGSDIYAVWNIDWDNADNDNDLATDKDDPWDFGASNEYPALKVDFNYDGKSPTWQEFGEQRPVRPPVFHEQSAVQRSEAENAGAGLNIGRPVTAFDPDGPAPGYGLGGQYAEYFAMDPVSGQLKTKRTLDYETKSSYRLLVIATDIDGHQTSKEVIVNVRNVDEGSGNSVDYDLDNDRLIDITTLSQLNAVRWDREGRGEPPRANAAKYYAAFPRPAANMGCPDSGCIGYELIGNLDFDENNDNTITGADATFWNGGLGWAPIGSKDVPYSGAFEGNRHSISTLYISRPDKNYAGLFAAIGGEVRNLRLKNVTIHAKFAVGGITGSATAGSSIKRSSVSDASLSAVLGGVGGLAAYNEGDIQASYATGSITGDSTIGGLVGVNKGFIRVSYSQARVIGTASIGGLVGRNDAGATILASYATGQVTTGQTANPVGIGGLVGVNAGSILTGYSTGRVTSLGNVDVGGLVGKAEANSSVHVSTYWNTESSTQTSSAGEVAGTLGGQGRTTAQLRSPTAYGSFPAQYSAWNIDWDNEDEDGQYSTGPDDPWDFGANDEYPALKVKFDGDKRATWQEFGQQRPVRPPVFHAESPVRRSVAENAGAGLEIGNPVTAFDPDGPAPTYSLETIGPHPVFARDYAFFEIDPDSGQIKTLRTLDYESRRSHDMRVIATDIDNNRTSIVVYIHVKDVDGGSGNSVDYDSDDDGLIDITTLSHLNAVRWDRKGQGAPLSADAASYYAGFPRPALNMGCPDSGCKGYELMGNLDFDTDSTEGPSSGDAYWNGGKGWQSIGDNSGPYTSVFEGNRHVISNLFINRPDAADGFQGLFGDIQGAVRNLGLENVDITGGASTGALTGRTRASSSIRSSYATGSVNGGEASAGGLVGSNMLGSTVTASYFAGSVTGAVAGGLIGLNYGTVQASYAQVEVTAKDIAATTLLGVRGWAGGLVGDHRGSIRASYATGKASADIAAGGLVGYNLGSVAASYTTVRVAGRFAGGLVGWMAGGGFVNSYWDVQTSSAVAGAGHGTNVPARLSKTSAELKGLTGYRGIYAAWNLDLNGDGDGDAPWDFGLDSHYPLLKADYNDDGRATWQEFGSQDRIMPPIFRAGDSAKRTVAEDALPGVALGRPLVATDRDGGSREMVYHLETMSSGDHHYFTVDPATGQLRTKLNLDYETKSSYTIDLTATDTAGETDSIEVTINVTDVDEGSGVSVDYDADDNGFIDITTLAHLDAIRHDLDSDGIPARADAAAYFRGFPRPKPNMGCPDSGCKGYELVANLDFDTDSTEGPSSGDDYWNAGKGWQSIGGLYHPYTGVFAGNQYTISNLHIQRPTEDYQGLFGVIGGRVYGLKLEGVQVTGKNRVGGLVGFVRNSGMVQRIGVAGDIEGDSIVGGLAGYNAGIIEVSYSSGSVSSSRDLGGLVGYNTGSIHASYSQANALNDPSRNSYVGGLAGANYRGRITASYSTGDVTGTYMAGGLVGMLADGSVTGSYSTGKVSAPQPYGGLVGWDRSGTVTNSYWNTETSRQTVSAADGVGKTTAELRSPTEYGTGSDIYADWNIDWDNADEDNDLATDVDDPWDFGSEFNYPVLKVDFDNDGKATWEEFGDQRPAGSPIFLEGPNVQRNVAENSGAGLAIGKPVTAIALNGPAPTYGLEGVDSPPSNTGDAAFFEINPKNGQLKTKLALDYETKSSYIVLLTATASDQQKITVRVTINVTDVDEGSVDSVDYDADNDHLIEITTLSQLDAVRWDWEGKGTPLHVDATSYYAAFPKPLPNMGCPDSGCTGYELEADLDFDTDSTEGPSSGDAYWNDGKGWKPILGVTREYRVGGAVALEVDTYSGEFEGNRHVISNLFINRPAEYYLGLFGSLGLEDDTGSVIQHLGLDNVDVTGNSYVGGLAGQILGGTIRRSYVAGSVTGIGTTVGGLVAENSGIIEASYVGISKGFMDSAGVSVSGSSYVGGLAGRNKGHIEVSYSQAAVEATGSLGRAGGLVALNEGTVLASYATGAVSGNNNVGGLVGQNGDSAGKPGSITVSYSRGAVTGVRDVGGLVGIQAPGLGSQIVSSYWDTETSGLKTSAGGRGLTTEQLQKSTKYEGLHSEWDVDLIWGDDTGQDIPLGDNPWDFGSDAEYPVLNADFDDDTAPTWQEFGIQRPNEPPVFPAATTTRSVAENTAAKANIGAPVRAADPDAGATLSYSLGATEDDGHFAIDPATGQLKTKGALDYETKRSYKLTVNAADGRDADGSVEATPAVDASIEVTVNVTDVDEAPVFPAATTTRSVAENTAPGTDIGDPITAADPDAGATLTYTLGGTDGANFAVGSSSGQLQTKAALDHERKGTHNLTVIATDGAGNSASAAVEVTVTDLNEPPVLADVEFSILEGVTSVGTLAARDEDADDDTLFYELDTTTGDHDEFTLSSGGVLALKEPANREEKAAYRLRVKVRDSRNDDGDDDTGFDDSADVDVSVTDVNEPPVFPAATTTRSVAENTAAKANIGAPVRAADPDAGATLSYSLGATEDDGHFAIDPATGQLQTKGALDYETKRSYKLTVNAADGRDADGSVEATPAVDASIEVTVNVTDVDEAPVFPAATTTRSVAENTAPGTDIGDPITAADPDAGATLTYTLGGTDGANFAVGSSSGQLQTKAALDHERKGTHNLTVIATDGAGNSASAAVEVTVTDLNEPPVLADVEFSILEGVTSVGTLAARDEDADDDTLFYELDTTTGDHDEFTLSSGGVLALKEPANREEKAAYRLRVKVRDSRNADGDDDTGFDDSADVDVSVTDVNEPPVFPAATTTRSVAENTAAKANIGAPVRAQDPDAGATLSYSLGATEDDGHFAIDPATGQLQTKGALDYEAKRSYKLTVNASDGRDADGSVEATPAVDASIEVTVNVTDVNEAPVFPAATTTRSVAENTAPGTDIGDPITAADPDAGATLTYTLGGTDGANFAVGSSSGQLQTKAALDHERKGTHNLTVIATDGAGNSASAAVEVTVTDLNEPPVLADVEFSILEGVTSVGTLAARDEDADDDTLFYELDTTTGDHDEFTLSSGGVLALKEPANREEKAAYRLRVKVRDSRNADGDDDIGFDDSADVDVSVTDVNEPPVFPAATTTRSVAENTAAKANIGAPVRAQDPDAGATLSYSLGATEDDGHFAIDPATGQLQTKGALDYETRRSYKLTVNASDGRDADGSVEATPAADASIEVTVNVTDVNEAPVFPAAEFSIAEGVTEVGKLDAEDPDAGEILFYALEATGDHDYFTLDSASGALAFKATPIRKARASHDPATRTTLYSLKVKVRDGRDANGDRDTAFDDTAKITVRATDLNGGTDYDSDNDGLIDVDTLAKLNAIRWDLNGDGAVDVSANQASYAAAFPNARADMGCPDTDDNPNTPNCIGYELIENLNLDTDGSEDANSIDTYWNAGKGWDPIGTGANPFTAIMEGNRHTIPNLFIDRRVPGASLGSNHNGLFGYIGADYSPDALETATNRRVSIRRLGLINVDVTGGDNMTGALVGTNATGIITACYSTGRVSGATLSRNSVGGLVGHNNIAGVVEDSYSSADVYARRGEAGGLVGSNNRGSRILASYATGDVQSPQGDAGGLAGFNGGFIKNTYATGNVESGSAAGGLVGVNQWTIINSYSTGSLPAWYKPGGLIGKSALQPGWEDPVPPTVSQSYWNTETSGQGSSPPGGVGATTAELQGTITFTGIYQQWDDYTDLLDRAGSEMAWDLGSASQYPALKADWDGDGIETVAEFGSQARSASRSTRSVGTPPGQPAAPEIINVVQTSFRVTWTAPAAGSSTITGYGIQYKLGGAEDSAYAGVQPTPTGTVTGYNLVNRSGQSVAKGTSYAVRVRASNAEGWGPWSDPAVATTAGAAPAPANQAPVFAAATATVSVAENTAAGTDIGVPVTATDPDGGDTLTYTLGTTADDDHFAIDSASGQLQTQGALDYEGKSSYSVTVTATDGGGLSASIAVSITVTDVADTPPGQPAAPEIINVKETSFRVTWAAPAAGSSTITGYGIQYKLTGAADSAYADVKPAPTGTGTGYNLVNRSGQTVAEGTSYAVRVRASNAAGWSPWSDAAVATTAGAAPVPAN